MTKSRMTYSEFYNRVSKKDYKLVKFSNELGERFYIIYPHTIAFTTPLITGDEYDWEMTPLFNSSFNMYSADELIGIGKALRKIGKELQNDIE